MEKRSCGCGTRAKSKAEMNADLTKDAKVIVAGVEGYSKEDHTKKAAEVKAAFPPKKAPAAKTVGSAKTVSIAAKSASAAKITKTTKAVAKSTSRSMGKAPKLAGISTGSHGGDAC